MPFMETNESITDHRTRSGCVSVERVRLYLTFAVVAETILPVPLAKRTFGPYEGPLPLAREHHMLVFSNPRIASSRDKASHPSTFP